MKPIAKPRIGGGQAYKVAGFVLVCLGVVGSCSGGAAMDPTLGLVGTAALALGVLLIAIGFWIGLFAAIEARLIDVQRDLRGDAAEGAPASPKGDPEYW